MKDQNREDEIRATFAQQAVWCRALGSPLTALVVEILGARLDRSSASGRRVLDWVGDTGAMGHSVPLRCAGALNGLVRAGQLPQLARFYPPHNLPDQEVFGAAVMAAISAKDAAINRWLDHAPQTNEVARSGVLYAGMAVIAAEFGLPLAIFEVGASAGLNLCMDRFEYDFGGVKRGRIGSEVVLNPEWHGRAAPTVDPEIATRRGCDLGPLDMVDRGQRERLLAYIWPDQPQRLARVNGAIALARAEPPQVDRMEAATWVEREIGGQGQNGMVRVLYHSIAYQYFPPETRQRIVDQMETAGARASAKAPLAWLAFEQFEQEGPRLTLRMWPNRGAGETHVLATAGAHVQAIHWMGK